MAFLMAAVGFAVGLGNIWRFPYIVGQSGGSAFIVVYLVCAFGIGVPLLTAELMIGRRGQRNPVASMGAVARASGSTKRWSAVGVIALTAVFLILTFYAVIAGWVIEYFLRAATGAFTGMSVASSQAMFSGFISDPVRMAFWQLVVIAFAIYINMHGIRRGIERANRLLMPALVTSLIATVVFACFTGDTLAAAEFLLKPDLRQLNAGTLLAAVGQAFFSIGIGMATMMSYGAHLDRHVSLRKSAVRIVAADSLVALLAGFAIFPLVFAYGLEPSGGPGLIFETLPVAFGEMPGGQLFGALFFLLLIVAAMTSCIGGFEPIISCVEEHWGVDRKRASCICGLAVWIAGLGTVLSFNKLATFFPLEFIPLFERSTIFDVKDFISSNVLLLVGGIAMSIFAGWIMPERDVKEELAVGDSPNCRFWRFVVRYLAPVALLVMFLGGIFS